MGKKHNKRQEKASGNLSFLAVFLYNETIDTEWYSNQMIIKEKLTMKIYHSLSELIGRTPLFEAQAYEKA
ncbi:MAG: hypothetical protein IJK38_03385 [Oscillospiraceae bacterium]|nr:hypothetical protein [Oscillospiraceae bacterium]